MYPVEFVELKFDPPDGGQVLSLAAFFEIIPYQGRHHTLIGEECDDFVIICCSPFMRRHLSPGYHRKQR
jgi:hypothetical protein